MNRGADGLMVKEFGRSFLHGNSNYRRISFFATDDIHAASRYSDSYLLHLVAYA